jgi:uncharacterized pyridoxamine 5'-phosphate oxidase family protein
MIRRIHCLILLILFLAGCDHKKIARQKVCLVKPTRTTTHQADPITSCEYITIWVHGTRLTPRCILKRIFHSPDGLIPAKSFESHFHLRAITDTLAQVCPKDYAPDSLFLYGWSGALGFKERLEAAQDLYTQIEQLTKAYTSQHNRQPKIRIITHSHGGNVVLNMAKINKDNNAFHIDELILLACPVQEETAHLIKNPFFKDVFALYSSLDIMQIIDPQGLYDHNDKRPLFSQRMFPDAENIMQVKIKLNGRALLHSDFISLKFVSLLPQIIDNIRLYHDQLCAKNPQTLSILSITTKTNPKHKQVS